MNFGEVLVVCVSVDDREFVFVKETGVPAFLLQECFHLWDEVVPVHRIHAGGKDVQSGDCGKGGGFEGVDCCFLVGVGCIAVVLDVVMDPGEGFIFLFGNHLIIRGAEVSGQSDEQDEDAKADGDEQVEVSDFFVECLEAFFLCEVCEEASYFCESEAGKQGDEEEESKEEAFVDAGEAVTEFVVQADDDEKGDGGDGEGFEQGGSFK